MDLWFRLMRRVFSEIAFCFVVAYKKSAIHGLSADEVKTILAHMPAIYRKELQAVLTR